MEVRRSRPIPTLPGTSAIASSPVLRRVLRGPPGGGIAVVRTPNILALSLGVEITHALMRMVPGPRHSSGRGVPDDDQLHETSLRLVPGSATLTSIPGCLVAQAGSRDLCDRRARWPALPKKHSRCCGSPGGAGIAAHRTARVADGVRPTSIPVSTSYASFLLQAGPKP